MQSRLASQFVTCARDSLQQVSRATELSWFLQIRKHGTYPPFAVQAFINIMLMKTNRVRALAILDVLMLPIVYPVSILFRNMRRVGLHNLPKCRDAMVSIGMIPIRDHYYEPLINFRSLTKPLDEERQLPGIDWNVDAQLVFLQKFKFGGELSDLSTESDGPTQFRFRNGTFEAGDAEYWYQLVRAIQPRRIVEIGSGNSTLMARLAIAKTSADQPGYSCDHVCIEPYEMPWLESTGVRVIRQRVEEVDRSLFAELEAGDVLFIDSSHVIRPQGDVLVEYLEILPILREGVIVHVHDIFSPRDYPRAWVVDELRLWNEQYLLEAFLSHNHDWEVIGALNLLHNRHYDALKSVAPFLSRERQPGSFYIRRRAAA